MLTEAVALYGGSPAPTPPVWVNFVQPNFDPLSGMQSAGYTVEYQHHDLPHLRQDDEMMIGNARPGSSSGERAMLYKVREEPFITGESATGYFRKATLTRVKG